MVSPSIAAALGRLQFDVLQSRLANEYGVKVELQPLPFTCACWLDGDPDSFNPPTTALMIEDNRDHIGVLFMTEWDKDYAARQNPDHQLRDHA